MVSLGFGGQSFAVAGALALSNLVVGKNEAIGRGIVGLSCGLMHFHDAEEVVEVALFLSPAGFLEAAELSCCSFELAGQSLAVHAEVGQGFRLSLQRSDDRHGFKDLSGELLRSIGVGVGLAADSEGKKVGFERGDAVQAPGSVGEGLDQVGFGGALRMVFIGEGF